jgi:MFS family permease
MITHINIEKFPALRWKALLFAAFLGIVFSANYTNTGPMVGTLVKELHITLSMAGFLTTAIFITHGLLQIPGGFLADKFGSKKVVAFGLFIIALCNIAAGFSESYTSLLLFKFLCGIGTGCAVIGGIRYLPFFSTEKKLKGPKEFMVVLYY